MDLDKAIQSRRTVRNFSSKGPDWRIILEAIDAARHAPMAGDIYTPRFILVSDVEKIQKLTGASQQLFMGKAKYVVVVCSATSRTLNAYGEAGKKYLCHQAGAAIQNFLLKLTELGLSTCWIGYFADQIVRETLKIPENVQIDAMFPIGYAEGKQKESKSKIDFESILFFDEYANKRMKKIKKIDT